MKKFVGNLKDKGVHSLILLSVSALVVIVMGILEPKMFLSVRNVQAMGAQFPEFGILSFGVMFAMIAGGIDLSLVGLANLSGIVAATTMVKMGGTPASIVLGIVLALVVGALGGLFNGFLIEYFEVPPMLATLATLQLYTGLGLVITKGPAISGLPMSFAQISNGTFLRIPIPVFIFIAVVLVLTYIINYTVYGQELLLYGTNEEATKYSGIDSMKLVLKTYMISGILGAISGILMASHYNSAKSDYGVSYTLLSLVIVVLGGTSPDGGKENLLGVVTSVVLLQLISSAFGILRISAFIKTFIYGLLLIIVVLLTMRSDDGKR